MFFKKKEAKKSTGKKVKKNAKKAASNSSKKGISEHISHLFKLMTDEQYLSDMTYGKVSKAVINFIKIFIASWRKFVEDDCFTKSTAITYTALMSMIPTLTVAFTFASIFSGVGAQREELFLRITKFLAEHNLQRLNIDPILAALSGLLDNAASIGGIGAAVMIFSATALLRTLEQSLNGIWKVKKQRATVLKVVYYWAALTLGPLMLIAGTTIAAQVSAALTSPNYNQVEIEGGQMWICGSKALIGRRQNKGQALAKITTEQIDFDNQRVFSFDNSENLFIEDQENLLDELELKKSVFNDMHIIDQKFWVVGDKGIVLRSEDSGKRWLLDKLAYHNLNDIHMFDENRGIIAADRGIILKTEDGGFSWSVVSTGGITDNLNKIAFKNSKGFIVADKGHILQSTDSGETWTAKQVDLAKVKKYYAALTSIAFEGKHVVITGDDGIILVSHNEGSTFKLKKFKFEDYSSAFIVSQSEYYVGSTKGRLIKTVDDGITWEVIKNSGQKINQIYASNASVWISGDAGMFMQSADGGIVWEGKGGKTWVYYVINFFAPFVVIWLLFFLIYIGMPNIKIPFGPAAIGAAFTGSVWVAFIFSFIIYTKSFANGTFAIYGALAAFPLFLLMIYASTVIILFGAELSYTLMYPASYKNLKKKIKLRDYIAVINGVRLLYYVYNKFESGKGDSKQNELLKVCNHNVAETEYFIELFTTNNLLLFKEDSYLPATSSNLVIIAELVTIIHHFSLESSSSTTDPVRRKLGDKFKEIAESVKTILGRETLADIIAEAKSE